MSTGTVVRTFVAVAVLLICSGLLLSPPCLAAESDDWAARVAEEARPAVVTVQVFDEGDDPVGLGSGFIVSPDGLVVTNYHVIEGRTDAIVQLENGSFLPVTGVVRKSLVLTEHDLVVLKVEGRNLPSLEFGDSDSLKPGEPVAAIGTPMGLEATLSTGIVSAVREVKKGLKAIQVTVPISEGSSGGPLLSREGKVVGVTSAFVAEGQNLNFAVPVGAVRELVNSLDDEAKADLVPLSEVEAVLAGKEPEEESFGWPSAWDPPRDGFDLFLRLMALSDAAEVALPENALGLAGLSDLDVVVGELPESATDAGLTTAYLKSYVELALRKSEVVQVDAEADPWLYVGVNAMDAVDGWIPYTLRGRLCRSALLTSPSSILEYGKPILVSAPVWEEAVIGYCPSGELSKQITDTLDKWLVQLCNDVKKANPEPAEPDESEAKP